MKPPSLRGWIAGALAFLAIVAPWPIALVLHYHLFPLEKLIGEYTIGRYTGVIENQSGPVWYYLPVIILGFFPWIAFLPMAIVYGVRQLRAAAAQPQLARLVRLAFAWIVMPLLFFSFARHETSELRRARIPGACANHRALFRSRRPPRRDAFRRHFGGDRAGNDRCARVRDCGLFQQQPPHGRSRRSRSSAACNGDCNLRRLAADGAARCAREERAARSVRACARCDDRDRRACGERPTARRSFQARAAIGGA